MTGHTLGRSFPRPAAGLSVIGEGLLGVGGMEVGAGVCPEAGVGGRSVVGDVVVSGALSETKSIKQSLLEV